MNPYLGIVLFNLFALLCLQVVVPVVMVPMVAVICVFYVLVVSLVPVLMVWTLSTEVTEHVLVSRNVGNSRGEHLGRNRKKNYYELQKRVCRFFEKEWLVLLTPFSSQCVVINIFLHTQLFQHFR